MTPPEAPSPARDAVLAALREAEFRGGRLHIFLGMCSGVGKTHGMLQTALQRQAEGAKVLVGFVETQGRRTGTANLLKGLTVLPALQTTRRDMVWEQLDIDAALE